MDSDSKIITMPMEHMVHDACLIMGYHNKISLINPNEQCFPKWKTLLIMFSNFCKKALTTFFQDTIFFNSKSSTMVYSVLEFTDQQTHRNETLESSTITGALRELSGSSLQLRTINSKIRVYQSFILQQNILIFFMK